MALKLFMTGNNQAVTLSDAGYTVIGNTGSQTVKLTAAAAGAVLDANIERVEFSGLLSAYTFQVVPLIGVQIMSGTTVVATIASLNQNATLAFANGSATLVQDGTTGAFSLGTAAVSTTTAAAITTAVDALDTSTVAVLVPATPTFSITGAAAVAEGASATYTVTLSAAQSGATSVAYTLAGTGGAVLGTDTGVVANGTLNFAAGEVTKTIVVPFSSDSVTPEAGEGVSVTLSGPSLGTALSATAATVTTAITDVPVQFSVAPNAAAVAEGDSVTFTVTLSVAQATASTVTYTLTGAGGAVLGTDTGVNAPVGNAGTLTFLAGETTKTIVVPVAKDTLSPEAGEGVTLTLATPSVGALSATATAATATITDVPVTYTLTASAASVYEGAAITYTLTASAPASTATTVDFSVVPGAASGTGDQGTNLTNLNDFTQSSFNPTSVVIAPGETTATYVVTSATDALTELTETYSVKAVIGTTEVATKSTTLLDGISATAGQTFTLTTGIDAVGGAGGMKGSAGSTSTALDDTIVGTDTTLTALDSIDGGLGNNSLTLNATGVYAGIPGGVTISNVQTINARGAAALTIDTTAAGITGVTALNSTLSAAATLTAAATTDIGVSGATGVIIVNGGKNITVTDATAGNGITVGDASDAATVKAGNVVITDTKVGAANIKVNGGSDVTISATGSSGGADTIEVGTGDGTPVAANAPTGIVSVTSAHTGVAATDVTLHAVTVNGGSTVTVTQTADASKAAADTTGATLTQGAVTVTAGTATTSVTVNQAASRAKISAVTGVAGVTETQSVKFVALTVGQTLIAGGLTFIAAKALTAAEVAAAFANLTSNFAPLAGDTQGSGLVANGVYLGAFTGWTTGAASGDTVVFTSTTANTNLAAVTFGGTGTAPTVTQSDGSSATGAVTGQLGVITGAVTVQDNATAAIKTVSLDGYDVTAIGTVTNVTKLETLSLANSGGATAGVTNAAVTANVGATLATLGLGLNNVQGAVTLTGAGLKTLNVTTSGVNSAFGLTANAVESLTVAGDSAASFTADLIALKTVTVSGSAGLMLSGNEGNTLTSVNTTATTGAVTATIEGARATYTGGAGMDTVTLATDIALSKAIDLGKGDDTLVFGVAVTGSTAAVNGGDGTDTLSMSTANADALDAAVQTFYTGFERLTINDSAAPAALDLANLGFTNYVTTSGSTGTLTLNNLASNGTVVLTAAAVAGVTVGIKDAATGTADVLNAVVSSGSNLPAGVLTAANVETINLTATDTNTSNGINADTLTLTADKATSVSVNGNAALTLTMTGSTKVTSIDGSAMTGALTVTSLNTTAATTIKGGAGNDVLTAATGTTADVLMGGDGNDMLVANAGLSTLTGGAGNDIFVIGVPSLNVNSYATITDFAAGDLLQVTGAASFASAKVTLGGTAVFQDFANAAMNSLAAGAAGWFQFGGDTYVVLDAVPTDSTTFINGEDFVIKLTGLVDLSNASFNNTEDTIALI